MSHTSAHSGGPGFSTIFSGDPGHREPESPQGRVFPPRALLRWLCPGSAPVDLAGSRCRGVSVRAASRECSFKILMNTNPQKSLGSSHCKMHEQAALCRETDGGSSGRGPTGSKEATHSCSLGPVCAASRTPQSFQSEGGGCRACLLSSLPWTKSSSSALSSLSPRDKAEGHLPPTVSAR